MTTTLAIGIAAAAGVAVYLALRRQPAQYVSEQTRLRYSLTDEERADLDQMFVGAATEAAAPSNGPATPSRITAFDRPFGSTE